MSKKQKAKVAQKAQETEALKISDLFNELELSLAREKALRFLTDLTAIQEAHRRNDPVPIWIPAFKKELRTFESQLDLLKAAREQAEGWLY